MIGAGAEMSRSFDPVSRTDLVRYSGAGGDFNPSHHDEGFATASGYPSVFGHGLYTAGLSSTALVDWLGPLALKRYAVRYVSQVWPNDSLTVNARIVGVDPATGERSIEFTTTATSETGEPRVVLTGDATANAEKEQSHA